MKKKDEDFFKRFAEEHPKYYITVRKGIHNKSPDMKAQKQGHSQVKRKEGGKDGG